jgi:hypothetical protein
MAFISAAFSIKPRKSGWNWGKIRKPCSMPPAGWSSTARKPALSAMYT